MAQQTNAGKSLQPETVSAVTIVSEPPHIQTLAAILMAGEIFKKNIKENEVVAVVNRNCKAAELIKEYFESKNQ